jgi:DNA-binding XRE family transcriptional regulator
VGARFEYERYGANWTTANSIIDSVHGMQLLYTNITTQLCFTVNIQNVYYLDELLTWADTKNFGSIYFNLLQSPSHMCVSHMTNDAKNLVLNKLKTTFWTSNKYQKERSFFANNTHQLSQRTHSRKPMSG